MSRNLETSVYSLDGNNIFAIAEKFERLAIQEMNRQPEYLFQGQDLTNARDTFNYKMQFDKLFSLIKEFYVKVNGVENLNVNEDVEDEFKRAILAEKNKQSIRTARKKFVNEVMDELEDLHIEESVDKVETKMQRILNANDDRPLKYVKLEMILDALNEMFKYLEENEKEPDFTEALVYFEEAKDTPLFNVLKSLENTYNENLEELKSDIMVELKARPDLERRAELRSTLRISRYEGSSSNVLRDILSASSSMVQDINNKRVVLQESIRQDEKIVISIKEDNRLILQYLDELSDMVEISKNYLEPYNKVIDNMGKIDTFVGEL